MVRILATTSLSNGAALAGCWMNTGEGGLSSYHLEGGCDIVFQIGTAKYGVRDKNGKQSDDKLREIAAIPHVRMFEIKLSQGAKPGKDGILPAEKETEEIAAIRGIPANEASISPNRHEEIDSVPDLLDMISHIREVTGKPVGFKSVIGAYGWLETMCKEIHARGIESAPDFITVDSGDGGTGAAPMPLLDNVGIPIKEALPMVIDVLARGFMFALGCIQSLKCNKNTCPTGITTHDRRLQRGLVPENKSIRVNNLVQKIRYGVNIISHSCGVDHPRALKRYHCRTVPGNGKSIPLDALYPDNELLQEYIAKDVA